MNLEERLFDLERRVAALEKKTIKKGPDPRSVELRELFIKTWQYYYKTSYPSWGPKHNTIVKRLAATIRQQDFEFIITAYFKTTDRFIISKSHPVELLESNLTRIVTDSGIQRTINQDRANKIEQEKIQQVAAIGWALNEPVAGNSRPLDRNQNRLEDENHGNGRSLQGVNPKKLP